MSTRMRSPSPTSRVGPTPRQQTPGSGHWPGGLPWPAVPTPFLMTRWSSTPRRLPPRSPGASPLARASALMKPCPPPINWTPMSVPWPKRPTATWTWPPAPRSPACRSMSASSAAAPTVASATCAPPPPSPGAARWHPASRRLWCRAASRWPPPPPPRASMACFAPPALSGASRVARCVWP